MSGYCYRTCRSTEKMGADGGFKWIDLEEMRSYLKSKMSMLTIPQGENKDALVEAFLEELYHKCGYMKSYEVDRYTIDMLADSDSEESEVEKIENRISELSSGYYYYWSTNTYDIDTSFFEDSMRDFLKPFEDMTKNLDYNVYYYDCQYPAQASYEMLWT